MATAHRPIGRVIGNAAENVGKPGLGIDVVQLRRDDQAVQERGTLDITYIPMARGFVVSVVPAPHYRV
jgi:hypothetical protein